MWPKKGAAWHSFSFGHCAQGRERTLSLSPECTLPFCQFVWGFRGRRSSVIFLPGALFFFRFRQGELGFFHPTIRQFKLFNKFHFWIFKTPNLVLVTAYWSRRYDVCRWTYRLVVLNIHLNAFAITKKSFWCLQAITKKFFCCLQDFANIKKTI